MSDLHVEAVESLDEADVPRGVDAPEYVLYGGKGGVGKTTMAAATALASARDGTATLVVSTDPAHSLSDSLGVEVPAEPARVHDEHPLYGVEIDPEAMQEGPFAGGEMDVDGLGGLGGLLGGDGGPLGGESGGPFPGSEGGFDDEGGFGDGGGAFDGSDGSGEGAGDPLSGPMPGADEAAAVQLLLRYLDDDRFERVVVDTAPTGHTLRLLELPDVMDSMVGRLLSFRERLSGMLDSVTGMFGGGQGDPGGMDPDRGLEDLRELSARVERLRDALRDPDRTDFRVVMVPEGMSVVETERLVDRLEGFGIPVGTVVVNRVMQDLAAVSGVEADWFVAPDLDSCAFCQRRWEVQRNALSRAQELFRGVEVKRVPLFADEVRGEERLRVVAACLE